MQTLDLRQNKDKRGTYCYINSQLSIFDRNEKERALESGAILRVRIDSLLSNYTWGFYDYIRHESQKFLTK
jgi:hypothetical protein